MAFTIVKGFHAKNLDSVNLRRDEKIVDLTLIV